MQIYNIAQIALCTYMAIGMWPATFPNAHNVFGLGTKYTAAGEWFILVHYLSKFMDWCAWDGEGCMCMYVLADSPTPNVVGLGRKYAAAGIWFILVHYLSKFMDC
jgi:hypothetical protein